MWWLSTVSRSARPKAEGSSSSEPITNGRDVMVRLLYGGRNSLVIGLTAAFMTTMLSIVLGLLAGFLRRQDRYGDQVAA